MSHRLGCLVGIGLLLVTFSSVAVAGFSIPPDKADAALERARKAMDTAPALIKTTIFGVRRGGGYGPDTEKKIYRLIQDVLASSKNDASKWVALVHLNGMQDSKRNKELWRLYLHHPKVHLRLKAAQLLFAAGEKEEVFPVAMELAQRKDWQNIMEDEAPELIKVSASVGPRQILQFKTNYIWTVLTPLMDAAAPKGAREVFNKAYAEFGMRDVMHEAAGSDLNRIMQYDFLSQAERFFALGEHPESKK